jgi:glucose-6-phosphate 1-dehydrogenase
MTQHSDQRPTMSSRVIPVEPFDLVIFGGTGDLARRKILPGLFRRFCAGQMPPQARVIGAARTDMDTTGFRTMVAEAIKEFSGSYSFTQAKLDAFLARIEYLAIDARGEKGWAELAELMSGEGRVEAYYFSVSPALFGDLAERLQKWGMADASARIVVEKPFGRDLETARALNKTLATYFDESQIYRIDHYLGKETVQNLMAVRFGNMLFEPLWNAQYVDHIQITVAETVGVGGRGEYYDKSGAMRDMVQNHLMQLLCLIAMEPPARFDPDAVRDEKLKVIRALDPVLAHHIIRGQYQAEPMNEAEAPGYRTAVGDARSRTEDAGKHRNVLSIRLQPNEGITLGVTIKEPGPGGMRLIDVPLDMSFAEALEEGAESVDAYERLIMDVIRGNQTLFMRGDEVEAAWSWTDPIIEGWEARNDVPKPYESGSDGPTDSTELMRRDGREWRKVTA